jgi:hypothetical protein
MLESIARFFIEAGYLWAVTAVVVLIASIINYMQSSSELEAFKHEIEVRKTRDRPAPDSDSKGTPAPAG